MSQIPKYFKKALQQKIIAEFGGNRAEFCRQSGFRPNYMRDMFAGEKGLSLNMMDRIAKFFGMTDVEMIALGQQLSEKKKPVGDTTNIFNLYRHKSLALELNKQLLEIEKLEPGRMQEFNTILDALLKSIKDKKEPYQPGKTDRRSGQDRRHASGG
jgi:plasmid maintenance system antidote protein VapI